MDAATLAAAKAVLSGQELAYAEVTEDTVSSTGAATDVVGAACNVTVRSSPIRIVWAGVLRSSSAGDQVALDLYEDGVQVGRIVMTCSTANQNYSVMGQFFRRLLTPGSTHTYKLNVVRVAGAGTITARAAATFPTTLHIAEV